jgi:hypothetical protein
MAWCNTLGFLGFCGILILYGVKCVLVRNATVVWFRGISGVEVNETYAVTYGIFNILLGASILIAVLTRNDPFVIIAFVFYILLVGILLTVVSGNEDRIKKPKN